MTQKFCADCKYCARAHPARATKCADKVCNLLLAEGVTVPLKEIDRLVFIENHYTLKD